VPEGRLLKVQDATALPEPPAAENELEPNPVVADLHAEVGVVAKVVAVSSTTHVVRRTIVTVLDTVSEVPLVAKPSAIVQRIVRAVEVIPASTPVKPYVIDRRAA